MKNAKLIRVDVRKGRLRGKGGGNPVSGGRFLAAEGGRTARRRIGLVCNGRGPSEDAVKYAVNACESLGAHLEVLHFQSSVEATGNLNQLIDQLSARGVHFRIVRGLGDEREERKEILRYAKGSSDILFIVIDKMSWKGIMPSGSGKGSPTLAWDSRCPLVVISGQISGSEGGGQP